MAKDEKPKETAKLSKKEQYGRFQQTIHQLGVDEKKSREAFELAFRKIVPAKRRSIAK
jgi:hypothetical protein